ncbi:hypothetical protein VFPPC_02403 [Pochonia chlamydosporia 170]|uniref:Uncharacterized protein n=1 Tax=Pochonia chlamydosporia 170 TaxID=1380566 RepID=A0A179FWU3_METCM|nr:hypothetical protein VFPPC_02403 [Pochonia chlamydosporia 170]OAQ69827.1 hypothetical protein VFPPC_02403 [Pochonia chlamydosporia 170]
MAPNTNDFLVYYQTNTAIWSTVSLLNVIIGFMVAGITEEFSLLLLVPIASSAGSALGGLSYFAYCNHEHPVVNRAVAAAFTNLGWMISEGMQPFYSYLILVPILHSRERKIFVTLFWVLMLLFAALRVVVNVIEVLFILGEIPEALFQAVITKLAMACFMAIALAECTSSVFLLKTFVLALRSSRTGPLSGGRLYRFLIRSTEIRVATLAFVGIGRTVTYPLRADSSNTEIPSNSVDIIASRLVFEGERRARSSNLSSDMVVQSMKVPRLAIQDMEADIDSEYHDDIEIFAERSVKGPSSAKPSDDNANSQENITEKAAAVVITKTEIAASDAGDAMCQRSSA